MFLYLHVCAIVSMPRYSFNPVSVTWPFTLRRCGAPFALRWRGSWGYVHRLRGLEVVGGDAALRRRWPLALVRIAIVVAAARTQIIVGDDDAGGAGAGCTGAGSFAVAVVVA